jgi:ribA/ribD-fused uncharacterized protein
MIREPIDQFRGDYHFLSNFYPSLFYYNSCRWPTAEHAYQASKTLDKHERQMIANASGPGEAKRQGQRVTLRPDWEEVKDQIMYEIVKAKFDQNPILAMRLRYTGIRSLIEGNTWGDIYWGVCSGVGQNKLGLILERVRSEL